MSNENKHNEYIRTRRLQEINICQHSMSGNYNEIQFDPRRGKQFIQVLLIETRCLHDVKFNSNKKNKELIYFLTMNYLLLLSPGLEYGK